MKSLVVMNLYYHRQYIWRNAWNEFRYHYAGTGMGIFWNVIHPLVTILLYTIIFSWIFPQRARGGEYVLYLTSGILAWRAFADTIQRGSNVFIEHARYLKRLTIPAEVFLAQQTLTTTFMLFIYYLLLMPINLLLGNRIDLTMWTLPVVLVGLEGLAFGISLSLANLRALFPDIEQVVQAFLPLWMWTLPVIYPETVLPKSVRLWLFLNPPYSFLCSIRMVILDHRLLGWHNWGIMIAWLLVAVWFGSLLTQQLESDVKESI
jgi:lipopolysaccharide transport system permease protein